MNGDDNLDPVMTRVQALMYENRLSWADIGRALNASPQRLYNWRRKGGIPTTAYQALADVLGCSIDYLVRGAQDDDRRHDMPPRPSDWAKLPQAARAHVGRVIHLVLTGKLTAEDIEFLEVMTRRMIHE